MLSAKRQIWARAAPSCGAQAGCPPGAARRRANGRPGGVPSGRIRAGGAAHPWLCGVVWQVMGQRPQLDLCLLAQPKYNQMSGSCARRGQRRPPEGSAIRFGCLLVGCRPSAPPGDSFLVSRRALSRSRPRGRIQQFEAAGQFELICCCFSPFLPITLFTTARGSVNRCSRSFGLSRAAS